MIRKLHAVDLEGPEGRLEAILEVPGGRAEVVRAVVLCHPHPQYGGTMHNKVVYRMARAARGEDTAVLRFNYRGVGTSSGTYARGLGEQDDLCAALRYLRERYPSSRLVAGGFSFGARIALQVGCRDGGIDRIIAVGTPVNRGDWSHVDRCPVPKHFIQSSRDEYGSRSNIQRVFRRAREPRKLTLVAASDHFFSDALDELEGAVRDALS